MQGTYHTLSVYMYPVDEGDSFHEMRTVPESKLQMRSG